MNRGYYNENAKVAEIITKLLSLIPGVDPMAGDILSSPLASFLSNPGSAVNSFIWPREGGGTLGASLSYMNDIYRRSMSSSVNAATEDAKMRIAEAYHKALNPTLTDVEIRNMAANSIQSEFSVPGLAQMFIDPLGVSAGSTQARGLASLLHNRTFNGMSVGGASYAGQIQRALFGELDTQDVHRVRRVNGMIQDILDNPSQYGNLSISDVMAVGKELALTNPTGYSTGSGTATKFNADKFREDVKTLSQAVEPWKEIFGTDIPKLLTQLEALTGRSVGHNASSLESSGMRMIAALNATGARVQHVAAYRSALAPALMDPLGDNRAILGAHSVATDMVLGLSNSSLNTLTTEEYQKAGGLLYTGTAKSKFADMYSLAFARWAGGGAIDPKDMSKKQQEFRRKYEEALSNNGGDHQAALLAASGATNVSEFEMYRGTDAFLASVSSGDGASASRGTLIDNAVRGMLNNLQGSSNIPQFIKNMDSAKFREFMASSRSAKIAALKDAGLNDSDATKMAQTLESDFSRYMSGEAGEAVNENVARAWLTQANNEARQSAMAATQQKFLEAVKGVTGTGSWRGIYNKIKSGKTGITDLIEGYTGGVDVLDALIDSGVAFSDISDLDEKGFESVMSGATKFLMNNYSVLDTTYKDLYNTLRSEGTDSKTREAKQKALRTMSALNDLKPGSLDALNDAQRKALIDRVQGADKDHSNVAKDAYIDVKLGDYLKASNISDVKLSELLKGETITSVKALKEKYLADMTGEDRKQAEAAFDKYVSESKLGDVDNIDPMTKILRFVEDAVKYLEKLAGDKK